MQWFKNAYDRAEVAEYILQAGSRGEWPQTEEYYPGFRRIECSAPVIGTIALLQHYPFRRVYNADVGEHEPVFNAFFRVHLTYPSATGKKTATLIEFDNNFAYLKRSSDFALPLSKQRDPTLIWDEAMAALDESLLLKAEKMGRHLLPAIVERVPRNQFMESAA